MRNLTRLAAALLAATPLAVQAQSDPAAPAAAAQQSPQPTPEQAENLRRGLLILQSFMSAMQSNDVPEAAKAQLYICMYSRTLAQISASTGREFEKNAALDRNNVTDVYLTAAGLCGVKLTPVAAGGN